MSRDRTALGRPSRAALATLLRVGHRLDEGSAVQLGAEMRSRSIAGGEVLVRAGSTDHSLYLVERGLLRVFFRGEDGGERVKGFVSEGMFFVALTSIVTSTPSELQVQALEDTVLWHLPYSTFMAWTERSHEYAALWRRTMASHFVRHESREAALQFRDARDRYRWFLEEQPQLAERVPLKHVASYLGVTDVTLSRARRAMGLIE